MFGISTHLPFGYIVFALIIGFSFAVFLYQKEDKIDNIWLKRILFLFRFSVVFFLSFLLLSPLINFLQKQNEKPILILVQDASTSVKDYNIFEQLSELEKNTAKDFDVFPFHFDGELKNGLTNEIRGSQTNFSNLFDELESRFLNRNVAAVVMATDGLYNVGENPIYKANAINFPIYSIALGDTIQQKDLLIKSVEYNEIAFLGNDFPIDVLIESFNCKSKVVEFKLYDGKSLLHSQSININKDEFYLKIPLTVFAKQKGLQKYSLQLSSLENEKNKANNRYEIFVDVLDSKYNILLLSDNSHPDIAAFKSVLEKNKHYSTKMQKLETLSQNIEKYNLVVLFGIPNNSYSKKLTEIINSDVPLLFFVNSSTNLTYFKNLYKGLDIKGKNTMHEVFASKNENFSLFTISSDLSRFFLQSPPIYAHFGNYKLPSVAKVLLKQKIGKITTEKPILFFENSTNKKVGVFVGEGFWKWKLIEFSEQKNNKAFDELFSKITQYLLLQDDKSHFRIKYKHKINANSPIVFRAEFYNKSYESITKNDVSLTIKDENGKEFPFTFSKLNKSYHLNVGIFPVGDYTFIAKVEGATQIKKGTFSITPFQAEMLDTRANHQLLYNLSFQSGGKMFFPNQTEGLQNEIINSKQNKTIIHTKKKVQEMINIQWILFTLLLLICTEWFIRKYNGLY
ncbi:MAG: hypothetical protein H8E84_06015 [Flavobacteriales bacterium]|nr:hypothetical protein [Flavobacteriales bacterium]